MLLLVHYSTVSVVAERDFRAGVPQGLSSEAGFACIDFVMKSSTETVCGRTSASSGLTDIGCPILK